MSPFHKAMRFTHRYESAGCGEEKGEAGGLEEALRGELELEPTFHYGEG